MKTVGSVLANVQNKHSAPGVCTLSGGSLHMLWKWTGDSRYLELLRETALTIGQYLSRDDRPIHSRDTPLQRLPQGYMCERVNLSDWVGAHCVGGSFPGSRRCECGSLTMAEAAGLWGYSGIDFGE